MIKISLISKSRNWPARIKRINKIIKNLVKYEKDLNFNKKIDYNCNIVLMNNRLIKKINSKYKKTNKGTDVLTFVSEIIINKRKLKMCDIFFSSEIIKKDALLNKVDFYDHLTHLIIHSFLHINGYLHDKIKDFNRMKKKEILVLKKIGIKNPYLEL